MKKDGLPSWKIIFLLHLLVWSVCIYAYNRDYIEPTKVAVEEKNSTPLPKVEVLSDKNTKVFSFLILTEKER